jgi:hypothetical protein
MLWKPKEARKFVKIRENLLKFVLKNIKRILKFTNFTMQNEECHYYDTLCTIDLKFVKFPP